jgi:hypothetical protein
VSASPLRSQAQHTMMTRAASDPDYAKKRGIEQSTAQDLLDQHAAAGSPKLPERVEADTRGSQRATPQKRQKPQKLRLLGME